MPIPSGRSLPTVLVVDDEMENLELIQRILRKENDVLVASNGDEALGMLRTQTVSLIIADMRMPGLNGAEFLKESVRISPHSKRVLITAYVDLDAIRSAVNDGQIHQLLQKPIEAATILDTVQKLTRIFELEGQNRALLEQISEREQWLKKNLSEREQELVRTLEELRATNAQLEELALRDGLTGVYNHRSFQERIREEVSRATRTSGQLALVFLDVDHFKGLNDNHGHPFGDQVLRLVASTLQGTTPGAPPGRKSDLVARYGGEEFALILPETNKDGATIRAERLRQAIANLTLSSGGGLTASFGVAALIEDAETAEELIGCADQALHQAKTEGRNRVVAYSRHRESPSLVFSFRDAVGELAGRLRQERALSILSLVMPDSGAIERRYGRAAVAKVCETFRAVSTQVASEALPMKRVVAVTSTRPEALDLFLGTPAGRPAEHPQLLDQLCELISNRIEQRLRHELASQDGLLLRVTGSHVTQLYARSVPVEHQLQRLVDAAREQATSAFQRRRSEDKAAVQRLVLNRSIESYLQPIVRADRSLVGYEVLSRGPQGSGFEQPTYLLDVAEDCDLTPELDLCMLEVSLRALERLPPDALLFVNVLVGTLGDETFIRKELKPLLDQLPASRSRVVLEISERQAAEDHNALAEALRAAKQAGLQVGMDDVGFRNANLLEIATFQPDWLKLDRSLVTSLHLEAVKRDLIAAILFFGHKQNSRIVAEGVEEPAELEKLRELGVEYFQGYLLGRPLPIAHYTRGAGSSHG